MRNYLAATFLQWSFKLAQGEIKIIYAVHMMNLVNDIIKYEETKND